MEYGERVRLTAEMVTKQERALNKAHFMLLKIARGGRLYSPQDWSRHLATIEAAMDQQTVQDNRVAVAEDRSDV